VIVDIIIGIVAFVVLLLILRQDRVSLGLPVAYLALLLVSHLPGAYAHVLAPGRLPGDDFVETGLRYTIAGAVCFVIGVGLARVLTRREALRPYVDRRRFWLFCLFGGWFLVYGTAPLQHLPSIGAAINNGAAVWILAVSLALRYALSRGDVRIALAWFVALLVYPVVMLVLGGFLSYGSAAVITACSILAVSAKRHWRVFISVALAAAVCLSIFVNYFQSRDEIRRKAWSNSTVAERVDVNLKWIRNFHLFDPKNPADLVSLDQRLNQNFFVGVAAKRIEGGEVQYLHGRSMAEAVLSVVPRAIWPTKPVFGGSPKVVTEMTGLHLSQTTSWGVGNIMELQINFGMPGVVLGLLGLGALIGWLDARAAIAENRGDLRSTIMYFLPGVALLQPMGSMVEMSGSAAAALVAALVWRWLWGQWSARPQPPRALAPAAIMRRPSPR
jgi:hypothetical protein